MDRRAFVRALGLSMLAPPMIAASQPVRVARVGYLGSSRDGTFSPTDPPASPST